MNGNDWQKIGDKYAQLLPYVSDRYTSPMCWGR